MTGDPILKTMAGRVYVSFPRLTVIRDDFRHLPFEVGDQLNQADAG